MKPNCLFQKITILVLAAALLYACAACVQKPEASTIRLMRTEGTVSVTDTGGKSLEPRDDLMLYSGYGMKTKKVSYAWINLDEVKLTKMDEKSDIDIQKDGKKLEITVNAGSLFFHVTQPLDEDEAMTIRTSSMAVGIRGTCGWVEEDGSKSAWVYLLEGKAEVGAAGNGSATAVSAGEAAHIFVSEDGKTEVAVSDFPVSAVPKFVLEELEKDEELAADILDASGLDVLNPPNQNEAARAAYDQVLAEFRDAHDRGLDLLSEWDIDWDNPLDLSGYRYITDSLFTYGWPNHYSYYDIDGNGVDELVMIDLSDTGGSVFRLNSNIYAFNGSAPVLLSDQTGEMGDYTVLTDGTILKYVGNGGRIGRVYRLSADGFTLEDVPDSPLLDRYEWPSERMLANILEPIPLF